ncbi:uncharacterized protein LOC130685557 [Daphnia carinata]|uniref:uncharacterized protein LOC130685557 n=1 Tax=Daphnia carinata TaxID=120202 RepID=UPI0025810093|nr:uncharacterized protein LOC130685557 [Daphnia carinata]
MFSLDDDDTSQSEVNSIGIVSVTCENEEKMYRNKSELYRRLECNMNILRTNPTDASAVFESTSRFDNLILNGSVSVPTSSFACNSKCIEQVSTIKIVNSPHVEESSNELEMTNLTGLARPMKPSTDDKYDKRTSARSMAQDSGTDSYVSPYVLPLQSVEQRKRRCVMAVTIAAVIGVTIVIVVIVLLTFSLHR